jgi:hypothetical protein
VTAGVDEVTSWCAVCGGATNHTTGAHEAAEADGFYDEHYTEAGGARPWRRPVSIAHASSRA